MEDRLRAVILAYLGDRYLPVHADWVELPAMASSLGLDLASLVTCCESLARKGLIELALPASEHDNHAAIITTPGLIAIGRAP